MELEEDVLMNVPEGAVAITIFGKAKTNGIWFPLRVVRLASLLDEAGFESQQFILRYTGQMPQLNECPSECSVATPQL